MCVDLPICIYISIDIYVYNRTVCDRVAFISLNTDHGRGGLIVYMMFTIDQLVGPHSYCVAFAFTRVQLLYACTHMHPPILIVVDELLWDHAQCVWIGVRVHQRCVLG